MNANSIVFLIGVIGSFSMMIMLKSKIPLNESSLAPLSRREKVFVWLFCLIMPVIAGAIFYYGWKKRLPIKAKQANYISMLAFVLILILIICIKYAGQH